MLPEDVRYWGRGDWSVEWNRRRRTLGFYTPWFMLWFHNPNVIAFVELTVWARAGRTRRWGAFALR